MAKRLPPASSNVRPSDVLFTLSENWPDGKAAAPDTTGRSLRRGLQVLDAVLQAGRDGVRVIDLCRLCDLPRAPVYRLLTTLIESGYVAQRARFHYVAGPRIAAFAAPVDESYLATRLQPVLARISALCGDASFAVVREGALSRCIAREIGRHPVQILSVAPGTRQPLGVGAAGLALLAALPPEEVAAVTRENGEALARFGGMTASRLALLVCATRERGWSVVGNHAVKGALGVGMVLRDGHDNPIAGISVAAAMGRFPKERQQLVAGVIQDALAELNRQGV